MMNVQIKSLAEPMARSDGFRALITRGQPPQKQAADQWIGELANVSPASLTAYERALREDPAKRHCMRRLLQEREKQSVTLLYAPETRDQTLLVQRFLQTVRTPAILVLYASEMGHTQAMAQKMAEGVQLAGIKPQVKDAFGATAIEINDYDALLLGSGTTGDGELLDEAQDIYDDLDRVDLNGMPCGVFGAGDTSYELYCEAVNVIHKKLAELGAELIITDFKVDFSMSDEEEKQALQLGKQFAEAVWDWAIRQVILPDSES
jgi:flavodoxin I